MRVTHIIAGIIAIAGGIFVLTFPGITPVILGWILTAVTLLAGLSIIINYIRFGKQYRQEAAHGGGNLAIGIILLILSILAIFLPGVQLALEIVVVIMFIVQLITNGAVLVAGGFNGSSNIPVFCVIFGFILIAFGVFGIVNIFFAAIALGIFVGIGLLVFGISMLFGNPRIKDDNIAM